MGKEFQDALGTSSWDVVMKKFGEAKTAMAELDYACPPRGHKYWGEGVVSLSREIKRKDMSLKRFITDNLAPVSPRSIDLEIQRMLGRLQHLRDVAYYCDAVSMSLFPEAASSRGQAIKGDRSFWTLVLLL